jgi:hypothetical protein
LSVLISTKRSAPCSAAASALLRWHLGSLAKYWLSKGFWSVDVLSLIDRAKGVDAGAKSR